MARPAEISDADIIAAGNRMRACLKPGEDVTASAIWRELGRRGRPERLLAVWRGHVEARAESVPASPLDGLPNDLRQQLDSAIDGTRQSLGGAVMALYKSLERTFEARYRGQLEECTSARAAAEAEQRTALGELGDAGEQLARTQARITKLEAELVRLGECATVQDALHRRCAKAQAQDAGRVLELERALAAARTRVEADTQDLVRSGELAVELRRELESKRDLLAQAHGQIEMLVQRVAELNRSLEVEQSARQQLAAQLGQSIRMLAGPYSQELDGKEADIVQLPGSVGRMPELIEQVPS